MIKIKTFAFNFLAVNSFLIYDDTKEAIIIDPAVSNMEEFNSIVEFVKKEEINIKYILNTHGHFDHICGNALLKKEFNVPVLMHNGDNLWILECDKIAAHYHIKVSAQSLPDKYIDDGDKIFFGNSFVEVLYVPGHSKGSLAYYIKEIDSIIVGDTLFYESIGRTDFQDGNYNTLITSIKNKIMTLPITTTVYPGHGDATTVEHELNNNYFIK